jgi:hypothetical protein
MKNLYNKDIDKRKEEKIKEKRKDKRKKRKREWFPVRRREKEG